MHSLLQGIVKLQKIFEKLKYRILIAVSVTYTCTVCRPLVCFSVSK